MLNLAGREEISRGPAELLEIKDIAVRIGRGPGGGHLDVQLGPVPGPGGVNRLLKPVFPPSGGGRISGLYATYYIRLFNSCWDAEGSIAN